VDLEQRNHVFFRRMLLRKRDLHEFRTSPGPGQVGLEFQEKQLDYVTSHQLSERQNPLFWQNAKS
jgi:hypothetical protein